MASRRQVLLLPLVLGLKPAYASTYPERAITWVVGFPAGGSADLIARKITDQLAHELRQSVVVLNKPGAGGTLASQYVAGAAPDGYTLLGAGATVCAAEALYPKLNTRLFRDTRMIAVIGSTSNVMVIPASAPFANLDQFIAFAKANPGKLAYASSGNGATPHLSAELFKAATGVDLMHVPYKGSAQALTDLTSGRVDVMFDNVATAMPLVAANKLRAFAVTASQPNPIAPGIPTLSELGIDLKVDSWSGLCVPANTPLDIQQKLNRTFRTMTQDSAFIREMGSLGMTINSSDWDLHAVDAYVKEELQFWRRAVEISGAVVS